MFFLSDYKVEVKFDWDLRARMCAYKMLEHVMELPADHEGTLRSCKEHAETWPRHIRYTVFLDAPGINGRRTLSMEEFEALGFPPSRE